MRILLVEDDRSAVRGIAYRLRGAQMVVDIAECGAEALDLAKVYDYDAVILDIMLPDIDGFDVVAKLRKSKHELPILMLSAISKTQAKVRGFEIGADDFMTKPFDPDELLARVRALVRRSKGLAQPTLQIGNIELDMSLKDVSVRGKSVGLTAKEYAIFELLALRKGTVLSKEHFLDHLYGGIDEPDAKIIDVFICKIRKKITTCHGENVIGTVWGRGYVLRHQAAPSAEIHEGYAASA